MNDLNKYSDEREQALNQALEAMYFGFKAMIAEPDKTLHTLGLSRVHHRILFFIARSSHCSVGDLLKLLQASKQYIHKPLRTLVDQGYVLTTPDKQDKRIKRLTLSVKGSELEAKLSGGQREHFQRVFNEVGAEAEMGWRKVMQALGKS